MTSTLEPGLDPDRCYPVLSSRDRRYDGVFYVGVTSTGIYCRPSCPARTPRRENARFYRTGAAAQDAGFRACRRCRPGAVPGSPQWDTTADVAGRAMRLIGDGVVDREGVPGLAGRLGFSERHLGRVLLTGLGAGPLALARARRAQTARTLVESTAMPLADVAFASGFRSVRQFNATVQQVYGRTPGELRRHADRPARPSSGPAGAASALPVPAPLHLRLACRPPFDGRALIHFLRLHAVDGVEQVRHGSYRRGLALPHGAGLVALLPAEGDAAAVLCTAWLDDLRDVAPLVERCRRLADLDADPVAVADVLRGDPTLAADLVRHPGLRVPGHPDGFELAVRAVLGQQVSLASARTLTARVVQRLGRPLGPSLAGTDPGGPSHLFPTATAVAAAGPDAIPGPRARARTLVALAEATLAGRLVLDRGAPRHDVHAALLAVPGVGPWTAGYVAMRALGDPDVVLETDVGLHAALGLHGRAGRARLGELARRWRPWGSYACVHLWQRVLETRWPAPGGDGHE